MSYPTGLDVARGLTNARAIRQFGRNTAVGATFTPIARGGYYRTPQVGSETTLRVRSGGNANDTATGTGARQITLVGLNAEGQIITDTIATNGASAGPASTKEFLRLVDAYVSQSGTYASQTALSHAGTINIESTGGDLWAQIPDTDIPRGDSEIGAYSVPQNHTLFITNVRLQSDASNKVNLVMFKREDILQTSAPYSGMILLGEFPSFAGQDQFTFDPPIKIPQLSDVGFLAKSATGTISVATSFDGVMTRP